MESWTPNVRKEENEVEVGGGDAGQGEGVVRGAVVGSLLSDNIDGFEDEAVSGLAVSVPLVALGFSALQSYYNLDGSLAKSLFRRSANRSSSSSSVKEGPSFRR